MRRAAARSGIADTCRAAAGHHGRCECRHRAKSRALAKSAGVSLEAPLGAMATRLETLKALGIDDARVSFAARFGRNMEYYTGFVFELWARDAEGPVQIAGGGRYDTLLEQLGAARAIPAIGFAIRTERVLARARRAAR